MNVYDYETLSRPNRWCREGVAVETEPGVLLDTFWSLSSETHRLTAAERETAVLRFDTDDFEELDRYAWGTAATWAEYRDEDRETITEQHGHRTRWFVRKGASPDHATKVQNARDALAEAESKLRSAELGVKWAQEDLDKLLEAVLS